MRIIAVGNQKGGVGKSTTVHNLGAVMAREHGKRVLMIDIDPQSSLTALCGVDSDELGMVEVMRGENIVKEVVATIEDGLYLIPSAVNLADVETELINEYRREDKLKNALAPVSADYDYCLIDCPPSLSLLTVNALSAAHGVIIPTLPQITDVRGLLMFLDTIEKVKEALNTDLIIDGILLVMFDGRLNHHNSVKRELANVATVFPVEIGRSIRIAEAGIAGQSLIDYDPSNKQLDKFRQLAKAVIDG